MGTTPKISLKDAWSELDVTQAKYRRRLTRCGELHVATANSAFRVAGDIDELAKLLSHWGFAKDPADAIAKLMHEENPTFLPHP